MATTIEDVDCVGMLEGFMAYLGLRKKDRDGKNRREIAMQISAITAGFGMGTE